MRQFRNERQYEAIRQCSKERGYPIETLCQILHVSRAGYYQWHAGKLSPRAAENKRIAEQVEEIHGASPDKGYRRIRDDLARYYDTSVNDKRVRRICQSLGIKSTIAYHLRQSFKPGEITPELANKIGYDLAMSLTKGKHAFIVCTHVDKHHIHSHIVFNSTAIDCTRKFRNFWRSSFAIRKISDMLCLENGLSVIAEPKPSRGSYGTWLGEDKPPTVRGQLEQIIDTASVKAVKILTASSPL